MCNLQNAIHRVINLSYHRITDGVSELCKIWNGDVHVYKVYQPVEDKGDWIQVHQEVHDWVVE